MAMIFIFDCVILQTSHRKMNTTNVLGTKLTWGGQGVGAWEIRRWEAGEERVGSGSSKRAGSWREMRNANYFNLTMR